MATTTAWYDDPRMRTSDGTHLHVETEGPATAPVTAIFSHGIGIHMGTWKDQRSALRDADVRQVYYDHRAFGRSGPWPGGPADIEQLAADLAEVVDWHAPAGPVVLVGHSMGTLTIQSLAALRPDLFGDRVTAVVLVAPPGRGDFVTAGLPWRLHRPLHRHGPAVLTFLARHSLLGMTGRAPFVLISWWAHGPRSTTVMRADLAKEIAKNDPRMLAAHLRAIFDWEAEDAFDALGRVRTVIVAGTRDRLVAVAGARRLAGAVAGAELVEYGDCGHMVHNEVPSRMDAVLRDVLAAVAGAGAAPRS